VRKNTKIDCFFYEKRKYYKCAIFVNSNNE